MNKTIFFHWLIFGTSSQISAHFQHFFKTSLFYPRFSFSQRLPKIVVVLQNTFLSPKRGLVFSEPPPEGVYLFRLVCLESGDFGSKMNFRSFLTVKIPVLNQKSEIIAFHSEILHWFFLGGVTFRGVLKQRTNFLFNNSTCHLL